MRKTFAKFGTQPKILIVTEKLLTGSGNPSCVFIWEIMKAAKNN